MRSKASQCSIDTAQRCAVEPMTAKGLRDVLGLRRPIRVTTDELWPDPPERLVPRWLRLPVNERVFSNGVLLEKVEIEYMVQASRVLRAEGVNSVAAVTAILTRESIRRDLKAG